MFDPKFNPFDELQRLQQQHVQLLSNQSRLSKTVQEQTELIQQMVQHLNKLTEAINNLDLSVNDLHGRLTLLEIARKYEDTNKTNHN